MERVPGKDEYAGDARLPDCGMRAQSILRQPEESVMNILKLAADAGMLVVLDGRIGQTEYRSVHGTLDAFQCFVQALESAIANADEADAHRCQSDLCLASTMKPERRDDMLAPDCVRSH